MKYLNVGANRLMDDTIMDIRDSLMENKVLMKLDLRATEITCFGCSELARVLKVNSVLEVSAFFIFDEEQNFVES